MGWGYTSGYPESGHVDPRNPGAPTRLRAAPDGPFDVAIVAVVLLSVLSIVAHAIPLYRWGAAGAVTAAASATARPQPSASSPTPTPTTTPSPSPSPSAKPTPPTPVTVPPTPVVDAVCLRADNPRTGAKLPTGDPFGDDVRRLGSGAELQRLFAVRNGALAPLDGLGAPRKCDQQLWTMVLTLAPTQVAHLEEFLVYDSGTPTANGVKVGESAPKQVSARTYDDAHWRLSLAPNGMDRGDLAWLVAHELAHIASLNANQMMKVTGSCPTEQTYTGCLSYDAYLARYLAKAWPDDLYRAWDRADGAANSDRAAELRKFFQAHRSSFITAYAATHPYEDFAESFAMWCTYAASEPTRAQLPRATPTDSGSKVDWFASLSGDLVPEFEPGCQAIRKFAAS